MKLEDLQDEQHYIVEKQQKMQESLEKDVQPHVVEMQIQLTEFKQK